MNLLSLAVNAFERLPLPDAVTTAGITFLCDRTRRSLTQFDDDREAIFINEMIKRPVAEHTDAANDQHYEIPPEFFEHILGPRRKYSCCLYQIPSATLAMAEEHALVDTARHADLADGQEILDLGCGWGSLSLWMAEHYPNAKITAVSNSHGQRAHIEGEAAKRGLKNLKIITADMNDFMPTGSFDRVVSVEMFEHMANWQPLLERIRGALKPRGRLFLHVFSHKTAPYRFDCQNKTDWIAQHFFTGGIMPSRGLIRRFDSQFTVEAEWLWNGVHYQRTALEWLVNYDRNGAQIELILKRVYGADWMLWRRRWRLFFLATAGLFGNNNGTEWGVSHYRLAPAP
ncbi:MAG: Cyclopropane-fatty-acyl-phospholipid synthase [Rhodospirillales bacterium]|nr:Cyclopropane-fatty-acyl-phospholipid synthase [Rhodospirillales bacterium]